MVAYFGPPGSFTHEVACKHFGARSRLGGCDTIGEVFELVESGRASAGIVPIYNSTGGFVNDTVDELLRPSFVRSRCRLNAELKADIHLWLMGRGEPGRVRRIYSHAIPLRHSRRWLARHHPRAELVVATSTSEAARRATRERGAAAIASEAAAALYGLRLWGRVRAVGRRNQTRFVTFSKRDTLSARHPHTAIGFGLAHRPGTLVEALTALAEHQINLTRIVSRPWQGRRGEYVFLVDFEGDRREERVQAALRRLRANTMFLRVLGTYEVLPTLS